MRPNGASSDDDTVFPDGSSPPKTTSKKTTALPRSIASITAGSAPPIKLVDAVVAFIAADIVHGSRLLVSVSVSVRLY